MLSKEAVLAIEYRHGKEEVKHGDFFAQTGATMGSSIKFDSIKGSSSITHHSKDGLVTQVTSPKHGSMIAHDVNGITLKNL